MVTVIWSILATLASAAIRVDLELCSSKTSPTKLLEQGNGQAGRLFMRVGFEARYEKVPNVYLYTNREEKPEPFYMKENSCFSKHSHSDASKCGREHFCLDTPNGYRCSCAHGYKMKKGQCVDVNECANFTHGCVGMAQCHNTLGGYECKCSDGLRGDRCDQDINECKEQKQCNNRHQMCINTHGSFFCQCNRGFTMDQNGLCNDIDECDDPSLNKCWSQNGCRNTPGSYKCSCPDGFRGNGINCNDKDECATGQHNCHELGECQNEIGSFKCVCNKGTLGNGTYCEEFPRPGDTLARSLHDQTTEQNDPSYDVGVQCALNDFYRPWKVPDKTCPEPSCEAKLDIINAWHTTTSRNNKRAAKLYGNTKDWWGWSGTITVPIDSINDFAVILRFPRDIKAHAKDSMRGNFETWNLQMRSFASSDGGYDLLLTPKDKKNTNPSKSNKYELLHPNQFQIVAQRLKSPYFPSIVFWNTTQLIDHNCFGEQTAANMNIMKQRVKQDSKIEALDDVRKIVLVNDEIRRLRRL